MFSDTTSWDSSISTAALERLIDKLRYQKYRKSTQRNYYTVWKKFNEFYIRLDIKPETWEECLVLFVGYLVETKKKSTTIKSYISAIKAVLMDDGIELNEDRYLINALTKACKYVNDTVRTRLPIRKSFLNVILNKIEKVFLQERNPLYLCCLYKALFATTYYGLFRVSEVTAGLGLHPIKARNVHIGDNKDKMLFILKTSKTHWTDSKPQIVKIVREMATFHMSIHCPFMLIRNYLRLRRKYQTNEEPFFIFSDRTPVTPGNYRSTLKLMLELCGVNPQLYGIHSMRVGRSVDLFFKSKLSVSTIKKLGRWKSNIVYRYLSVT